jgi:hypothetical protein
LLLMNRLILAKNKSLQLAIEGLLSVTGISICQIDRMMLGEDLFFADLGIK